MVIQVNKREITEINTETNVNNLERSFKVFSKIQTELDNLRSQANIDINTELFVEMYKQDHLCPSVQGQDRDQPGNTGQPG